MDKSGTIGIGQLECGNVSLENARQWMQRNRATYGNRYVQIADEQALKRLSLVHPEYRPQLYVNLFDLCLLFLFKPTSGVFCRSNNMLKSDSKPIKPVHLLDVLGRAASEPAPDYSSLEKISKERLGPLFDHLAPAFDRPEMPSKAISESIQKRALASTLNNIRAHNMHHGFNQNELGNVLFDRIGALLKDVKKLTHKKAETESRKIVASVRRELCSSGHIPQGRLSGWRQVINKAKLAKSGYRR